MVNTEFTHICSATVQNSSGTLLVSACGASGRRSVVAIRRMTVPRIALVMAIRQVDAAMRHFSFQHQSPIEALGVGMRVSRTGGDAGHALAAGAYPYFQHPADERRQAPLPPLTYPRAPRLLGAGRHVRRIRSEESRVGQECVWTCR